MPVANPVVVGVAQFNPHRAGLEEAPEPLEMMARVARAAAEDSGVPKILDSLDALAVVNIICWSYPNAPGSLAAKLGINPRQQIYTTVGGNTPQYLINHFAAEIAAGKIRAAMVVGCEAMHTLRRAMKRGGVTWGQGGSEGKPTIMGDSRAGTTALEEHYGARWPVQIYPLFENGRRAHRGWSMEEHRRQLGRMCAAMTRVAAKNPYAWFPTERTPEEIATVSPDNRIICFPYPKWMNAIIDVDLAAAVIIMSDAEARRLGIGRERMVHLRAGADATEHGYFISERPHYHGSPAMKFVCERSLGLAGVGVEKVAHFDFYSCFPVAVGFAMDALGLSLDDPRGTTVTGGLPYAGGPGNNYTTHAIAAMVDRLRAEPGKIGLVTALGWYLTKHSAGVYSSEEPQKPFAHESGDDALKSGPSVTIAEHAEGRSTVETYTVIHDRAGEPTEAIVIGRLENGGARFIARAPKGILSAIEREEFIGRRGGVRVVDGANLFQPT
jgi:acetyl-CoA C-acetyltransferase